MENHDTFHFTYSAREQDEIKAIRMKYAAPEEKEDKLARLRRLDADATGKATAVSLILGIVGALVMGSGMSLIMTEIGKLLQLSAGMSMVLGIIIGIIGIVLVSLAYPVYNRILKLQRAKIAPEIIRLSDELMQ